MKTDFICGCTQSSETITFAGLDSKDPNFEGGVGPCQLVELSDGRWRRRKIDGWLIDVTLDRDGQVMALTTERHFIRPALDGPIEQISEPRPPFAAFLSSLRAIGRGIYACGGNGLVFRREQAGWRAFATALLTPFPTRPDNFFTAIDGSSEDSIYLLAHSGVFFWDGTRAHPVLDLPNTMMVALHIERPDLVWMCGPQGVILRGNFRDGFARIDHPGRQMFLSIIGFEGKIYLAGDDKLWVYDGRTVARVDLGTAKHRPIRNLTCAPDVLWAVGDDLFRLKAGGRWEPIPYDPPWLDDAGGR